MSKKIKLASKVNLAPPIEVDEAQVVTVKVNLRDGPFEVLVAMINDGGIVEERWVHIGLDSATDVDLDKLESDVLKVIQKTGVLPAGGTIEES